MTLQQFISTLPIAIVGLAAFVSLVSFRYQYPDTLKKLSLLWGFNFCVDLAGHITRYFNVKNNWIYNIYFWVFFLVMANLYSWEIQNQNVKKIIRLFYVLFPLVILGECVVYGIRNLQTGMIVTGGTFIIFLAIAYFRQLYLSDASAKISRDAWFWFSFGLIIYWGGSVPFLGMLNYLFEQAPSFTRIYYLYFVNSFAILLNILIITGFLCQKNYLQKLS